MFYILTGSLLAGFILCNLLHFLLPQKNDYNYDKWCQIVKNETKSTKSIIKENELLIKILDTKIKHNCSKI